MDTSKEGARLTRKAVIMAMELQKQQIMEDTTLKEHLVYPLATLEYTGFKVPDIWSETQHIAAREFLQSQSNVKVAAAGTTSDKEPKERSLVVRFQSRATGHEIFLLGYKLHEWFSKTYG